MTATPLNQLIPIAVGEIGNATVQTVSARALHNFLGVGRDFTNWIKDRIEQYQFIADVDFTVTEDLSSPNPASAKSRAKGLAKLATHFGVEIKEAA